MTERPSAPQGRASGEFDLIARHFAPLARGVPGADGLRNDAAVFQSDGNADLVVTADAMVEGVHFLPEDPPGLVGRKLIRVNLSDLAAMGARPRGYLLTVAVSDRIDETWIEELAAGLAADQREFEIGLFGGDTVSTPGPLTLSLTAIGEVTSGRALARSTAHPGDHVYVSGTVGDGALGLLALRGALAGLRETDCAALAARYRLPQPRLSLGQSLAGQGLATAAIDVSDGLVADLGHIAGTSKLGARIEAASVPLSAAGRRAVEARPELREAVLTGGDDYELLFTAPSARAPEVEALAGALDLPVTRVGAMVEGDDVRVLDEAGEELPLPRAGWTHF